MSSNQLPSTIPPRYTRSIHIERDFAHGHVGVRDYQATPLVLQTVERILAGLRADSTARAFSLTGPYGSGKSAFGVFLAHYLKSIPAARRRLIAEHSTDGIPHDLLYDQPTLLPVLISGNNESLRRVLLRGLLHTFESLKPLRDGRLGLPARIADAASAAELDPQQVADLFAEACTVVAERTAFGGLVLIIDELGQFLDYAARQGDERDLFVLQTLAEMAARSGGTPCVVLTILHQAFDRYTASAGATRRNEWAKVQGRFVELPFQEPPIQMLRMVGRALCPDENDLFAATRQRWAEEVAPISEQIGLRPPDVDSDSWRALIARAYPLHPTVLVALPLLFRQLAQNERSLFAFLTSPEPWSVRDFLQSSGAIAQRDELPIYRLPLLYAYIHATLGASLFGRARGQRWAELAEALALLPQDDGVLPDVLTTIGTLGALGQGRGLRASRGQVAFALRGQYDETEVERALNELDERKQISYRQHRDSFVVWEGSDLDIDELTQEARREIGDRFPLVRLLEQHADSTPLVARRHSYETGAVRVFAARFVDLEELLAVESVTQDADGELLYVVPTDDEALQAAEAWVRSPEHALELRQIVVLPRRVRELRDLLMEVAALQQVLERPELESDRAARREVSSRLVEAQQVVAETISATYGPGASRWYWRGKTVDVSTARAVDELLSRACDETYSATPRIWNELIVRRQLSSAAAKARRNLIEAMLEHATVPALGLEGYPPERAIYESVLHTSSLHRQEDDGVWRFGPPPAADVLSIRPVWDAIVQFFVSTEGQARPLNELYAQLEAPPFGVKAGLTPLLFVAAYLTHAGEIALYEHGNYVTVPDIATFERLLRQPGYFALRRSRATGVRIAVYERMARALAPQALERAIQPAVLDAVTPLLRLVKTLPVYARSTRTVSQQAQAIRQALLDAPAPDELLFEQLPFACDLDPFAPDQPADEQQIDLFFTRLREGLQELQTAYAQLIERVSERIRVAFGATAIMRDAVGAELTERYRQIAATTNDSQLRALGVRLENAADGDAWVESVAALVGHKPADAWSDADAASFDLHIAELGRRFKVAEQMAIMSQSSSEDLPVVRVGIANGKGEVSTVFRIPKQNIQMDRLRDELKSVLARYDTLSLEQKTVVLTELLQPHLEQATDGNGHI